MKVRFSIMAMVVVLCMAVFSGALAQEISLVEIQNFADPMSESLLKTMNGNEYSDFSKDFSDEMKQALNEKNYDNKIGYIKEKIGVYIDGSKELIGTKVNNQDIIVNYKAKFTKENDSVIVTLVFKHKDNKNVISGLWFNSPKLYG